MRFLLFPATAVPHRYTVCFIAQQAVDLCVATHVAPHGVRAHSPPVAGGQLWIGDAATGPGVAAVRVCPD